MISKRGLIVAGALGTGSVVFAASSALACDIKDFKIDTSVTCVTSTGQPTAQFTVQDNDSSHTQAVIDIYARAAGGANGAKVASVTFDDATKGQTRTVSVPWVDNGSWNVVVEPNHYVHTAETSTVHPAAGGAACTVAKPVPSTAPTSKAPVAPIAATSSAPATPSSSPSGKVLAETGGGSDSGMIAGFAAALVVAGGGVLFAVRRRAAGRHN